MIDKQDLRALSSFLTASVHVYLHCNINCENHTYTGQPCLHYHLQKPLLLNVLSSEITVDYPLAQVLQLKMTMCTVHVYAAS